MLLIKMKTIVTYFLKVKLIKILKWLKQFC